MKTYNQFIEKLISPLKKLEKEDEGEYFILVIFLKSGRVQGMVSDTYFSLFLEQCLFEEEEILDSFIYSGSKEQIKSVLKKSNLDLRNLRLDGKS